VFSSLYVYTTTQTIKFSESHLHVARGYLDCFAGFVSREEKPLFASLVSSAPKGNIVTFEEPDIIELPNSPPKAPKEKDRAKKTTIHASSRVVTRSASKTPVEPPTFLRSPSGAPSVAPSVAPYNTLLAFGPQFIVKMHIRNQFRERFE
jgi:hypothetical protein